MAHSATFDDSPVREQHLVDTHKRGTNTSTASFALASLTEHQISEASQDEASYTSTALQLARQASLGSLSQLCQQLALIDPNYISRTASVAFEISRVLSGQATSITDNRTISFNLGSKDLSHTQLLRMLKASDSKVNQQATKHVERISGPIPSTFDARTPAPTPNGQVIDCT